MTSLRRSIATVSLSGSLDEKLSASARAGFDGVEIFESDLVNCPWSPAEIRQRATHLGLAIEMYQPFRDFEAVTGEQLARNLRRAECKFAVMEQLGADTMLVCSNTSADAIDDDSLAAEQLYALAERADERGMRIAYEALAWGRHVDDYRRSWQIVEAADHPALGICLDSFHILSRGHDPSAIRTIPGDKVFFLQLADAPYLLMDVLQWSRHYRCFPGQGGFDLTAFVGHVLAAGYRGPLSLEVFNDVFRQSDANRTAVDALRSLLALEESVRSSFDLDQAAQRQLPDGLELFAPPPPVPPSGHAFVEVAVDEMSAPVTERALATLGFVRIGKHLSKAVTLWQQGGARILVNHEAVRMTPVLDGDALVSALAVETTDPLRSARRAEMLLSPILTRERGPAEAYLSAVAAPDGTSVFFCRSDAGRSEGWLGDFVAVTPAVSVDTPGLTRIDHVGLAQPFDQFDEAALFYRSVLGLQPQESMDLAAPDGLVRSRALASAGGSIRIALNVSVVAGATCAVGMDSQHIAFACDDIFRAAEAMRTLGAELLVIPDNYYDDLAARHELAPDLLVAMRACGVLYDRDDDGEFLHLFTPMIGRRLFLEVVQRVGGYDGYGAVNAPVRMAAQRATHH